MGFKKYVVFSILFIAALYGYLFSLELGDYRVTVLDISLTLPVAVWIIVPLAFLFIATVSINLFTKLLFSKTKSTRVQHVLTGTAFASSSRLLSVFSSSWEQFSFSSSSPQ